MASPFQKVMGVIGNLAPTIASCLPIPAVAGVAVGAICKAVAGDAKAAPGDVEQQILSTTDPNVYAQIKKAEQDFKLQMEQVGIDLEKIAEADRASAREREVAVKDKTPRNLAYLAVACFWIFATAGILIYFKENIDANRMALLSAFIGTITGYAIGEVKQVFTYYFGSSSGSAEKTELLAKANPIQG